MSNATYRSVPAGDVATDIDTSDEHRRSLRILRVSTDMYPEVLGGGAIHAHKMSVLQAELGHDVTVLTSDHGEYSLPRREDRGGYTIRRFREWGRPLGNSLTPGLFRALRDLKSEFDVLHAHSHLYLSTNMAAILAYFDNTPLIITNHGLFSQSAPSWFNHMYLRTLGRFTFNAADRVLCYTDTDEQRLRDFGVSTPVSLVHNGVDCEMFAPVADTAEPPEVLFVGRLVKTKGVRELIEAFGKVDLDARLRIVGEGPLRETLENRVQDLGLETQVIFTGRIPNEELPKIYSQSAVFALPSIREGLPRTLLEALACGTPVITFELPQFDSLLEGVGITVQKGNVRALATELERLLSDETLRNQLGTAGRSTVVGQYSWAESVRRTTTIYYQV